MAEQICFQFDQKYYKETEGLSKGAPTFTILAEVCLQHIEHKQLYPVLMKYQYFRYVDHIPVQSKEENIHNTWAK